MPATMCGDRGYIIIDYLEDPKADADAIRTYCEAASLKVQEYICAENAEPQVWDGFIGAHNFGFLIEGKPEHTRTVPMALS